MAERAARIICPECQISPADQPKVAASTIAAAKRVRRNIINSALPICAAPKRPMAAAGRPAAAKISN